MKYQMDECNHIGVYLSLNGLSFMFRAPTTGRCRQVGASWGMNSEAFVVVVVGFLEQRGNMVAPLFCTVPTKVDRLQETGCRNHGLPWSALAPGG